MCFLPVPGPPENFQIDLINDDPPMTRIMWTRPLNTHGAVEGYKLVYGPKGGPMEQPKIISVDETVFTTGPLGRYKMNGPGISLSEGCIKTP